MTINEIVNTPSRSDSIEKYQIYYPDTAQKIPAFDALQFCTVKSAEDQYLGLFYENTLVSHLHIEIRTAGMWQITYSLTREDFQKQGCFRYLLLKGLESTHQILSDSHQTPQARAAWKSLIRYPSSRMKIFVYDIANNVLTPTKNIDLHSIWNNEDDPVLLAVNVYRTQEVINQQLARDRVMEKYNRNYDKIWFGKGTSNSDYINP